MQLEEDWFEGFSPGMNASVDVISGRAEDLIWVPEEALRALDGVSLSIARDEFVAVVGPSGLDKSKLMNILGCLDRPTAGQFSWTASSSAR